MKSPIRFGRLKGVDIQFSNKNIYISEEVQFRIEYDRPHFCLIDMGNEYPTLVRCPRHGKKKILLTRYDYISLAEESDFYIVEFTADEK
jgi:hypothetical protein